MNAALHSRSVQRAPAARVPAAADNRATPAAAASSQRTAGRCACGGDCPRCRAPVWRDPSAEREADRSGELAMRGSVPRATPASPGGSALPMATPVRALMERRLGHDFQRVRVHADEQSARAAGQLGASAFTVGEDISFARGRYAPHTAEGRRLLGHELAHVVQQRRSGVPRIQAQDDGGVRHVYISGGVPDFLSCTTEELDNDPDTSCCSDATRARIPVLYDRSREHTDRALQRVRSGANMDGAITAHFGSDALWYRNEITRRLQTVRDQLDRQSSHVVRCRIALTIGNEIGVDLLSHVDRRLFCRFNVLATGRVGGNVATLCVDADGVPAGGWVTLLHEMVHLAGIGDLPAREDATPAQVSAGEFETYEGAAGYPNPMPFSLRNADSFANFVEDVGAQGWSEESDAAAFAPTLELGAAMSLEELPRPGLAAGMLWTPFGSSVQMIVGARALWLPQREAEAGVVPPTALRAYAGPELGLRWIVGGDRAQFVLDVAGGAGTYVTVEDQVDPAVAARLGLGVRFGGPRAAFGIGADFMRLFHFDEGALVGGGADDWLGGIMLRGHWGGSSARPR